METVIEKIKVAGLMTDGDHVYFGEYPQTAAADGITFGDAADEAGYFRGSDGCRYAKATAKELYDDSCRFHSGKPIVSEKDYYFKVEPLRWRVLRAEGERVLLMSDGIIDTGCFDGKTRIYEKSELRRRVTEDIYKAAFSDAQRARIEAVQLRKAENDPASSDVCDRIFILSLSDIPRDQAQRILKATDYAIAMGNAIRYAPAGILARYTEENYGDGFWWLRSCIGRSTSTDAIADYVDFYGNAGGAYQVCYKRCGIVPAIWIKI